ncbi:hypothetical protein DPMN_109009 [Dreissena polymorpha]|uniref:Uncharacterized protein n=1 Tax=Dreissena polymorpha TaxID=45954 RepID=A0A9D4QLJ2_DREPO|nr:hypothetical protein DPMN_109009 [Dreissena polymorpha]
MRSGCKPSPLPDHPDYVPSVFSFTPARITTPKRVERFERSLRRRIPLKPVTEEGACSVESLSEELACDQTSRDEAAFTLLALGGGLATYSEAGTNTDPDPPVPKFEELQQDYIGIQKEYQRLLDEISD